MKTTIVLTMADQKRVEVIERVFRGEVTMAETFSANINETLTPLELSVESE